MRIDQDQVTLVSRVAICDTHHWQPNRRYWNEKWEIWTTLEHATMFTDVTASNQTDAVGDTWYRCVVWTEA